MGFFSKRKETRRAQKTNENNPPPASSTSPATPRHPAHPPTNAAPLSTHNPRDHTPQRTPATTKPTTTTTPTTPTSRRRVGRLYRQSRVNPRRKSTTAPTNAAAARKNTTPTPHKHPPTHPTSIEDRLARAVRASDVPAIDDLVYTMARTLSIRDVPLATHPLSPDFASTLLAAFSSTTHPRALCKETRGNAALVISELAVADTNARVLVARGAVDALLAKVAGAAASEDPRVVGMAARALRNLLADWREAQAAAAAGGGAEARRKVTEEKLAELFLSLLGAAFVSGPVYEAIFEDALEGMHLLLDTQMEALVDRGLLRMAMDLWRTSRDHPGSIRLTDSGGLQTLASIVAKVAAGGVVVVADHNGSDPDDDPDASANDDDTSALLSAGKWNRTVVAAGGLDFAVHGLAASKRQEVVSECARVLANVAASASGARAVVEAGGVEALVARFAKNLARVRSSSEMPPVSTVDIVQALGQVAMESAGVAGRVYTATGQQLADYVTAASAEISEGLRLACKEALVTIGQCAVKLRNHLVSYLNKKKNAPPSASVDRTRVLDFVQEIEFRCDEEYREELPGNDFGGVVRASIQMRASRDFDGSGHDRNRRFVSIHQGLSDPNLEELPRGSYVPSSEVEILRQSHRNCFEMSDSDILGRGGYGTVFRARDLRVTGPQPTYVAIKRLHLNKDSSRDAQERHQRALREARIWKKLDHANVVKFVTCFLGEKGELNLVAEYINGQNLAELRMQFNFSETVVAEIAYQVLEGLEYMHRMGVVHRDLKPANLLVASDESRIKITDFGVSWSPGLSAGTTIVGTPAYISPEMLNMGVDRTQATGKVDIWALGSCVYEMVTGKRPFDGVQGFDVLVKIMNSEHPTLPSSMSHECRSFIMVCWTADPNVRPSATSLKRHPFLRNAVAAAKAG